MGNFVKTKNNKGDDRSIFHTILSPFHTTPDEKLMYGEPLDRPEDYMGSPMRNSIHGEPLPGAPKEGPAPNINFNRGQPQPVINQTVAAPGQEPISAVQKLQDRYQNLLALKAYRSGRNNQ